MPPQFMSSWHWGYLEGTKEASKALVFCKSVWKANEPVQITELNRQTPPPPSMFVLSLLQAKRS